MGSSILRCFSSYYGLIMWLISTRWPQRDKRPQGLDLLKLSLSGCFFFFLSHLSLRERAEAQKAISRRVHNETDTRTLLLNLSERVWAVKYLWKLCCVCARVRVYFDEMTKSSSCQADCASLAFGGSLHTWFIPCYPPTLLFMTYFSFETRFITWITWRSFPGPIFFTNSRI